MAKHAVGEDFKFYVFDAVPNFVLEAVRAYIYSSNLFS